MYIDRYIVFFTDSNYTDFVRIKDIQTIFPKIPSQGSSSSKCSKFFSSKLFSDIISSE